MRKKLTLALADPLTLCLLKLPNMSELVVASIIDAVPYCVALFLGGNFCCVISLDRLIMPAGPGHSRVQMAPRGPSHFFFNGNRITTSSCCGTVYCTKRNKHEGKARCFSASPTPLDSRQSPIGTGNGGSAGPTGTDVSGTSGTGFTGVAGAAGAAGKIG